MGEAYGERPTELLGIAHEQTSTEQYWMDAGIRQATAEHKKEKQDEVRENQNTAGAASPREKDKLHKEQEQRAELREAMEQTGKQTPDPEGQLELLESLEERRDAAVDPTEIDADNL